MAAHRFESHTGEVQLALTADSREALYAEAARALAELTAERLGAPTGHLQAVTVSASDPEALLVAWLNELVFLSETRHQVYTDITVEQATETELTARIGGRPVRALRTAVKAATYHDLRVQRTDTGWEARVVLDV